MPITTTTHLVCDWPGCNTHLRLDGHGYGVPIVPPTWRLTFDKALCPMHAAENGFAELYAAVNASGVPS